MNIVEEIQDQAKQIVQQYKSLTFDELNQKLNAIEPTIDPHKIDLFSHQLIKTSKEPTVVLVNLMVQDIREQEFFYSFLIKTPITQDSQITNTRYCEESVQEIYEKINNNQWHVVMSSSDVVMCCTQKYCSEWICKEDERLTNIRLVMKNHEVKLGSRIQAFCIWNPTNQSLEFIRYATRQQILGSSLNFEIRAQGELVKEYKTIKNRIISLLSKFIPQKYACILLFSIINNQGFFINGPNLCNILRQLLPRVAQIKIQHPFNKSLFPYKNENGELVDTPMQMSSEKTFVVLDFSELTEKTQVKISGEEIDNLKALKIFIEDGVIVHRWQYGQSLFPHNHSGIIVKASSILCPHFKYQQNVQVNKDIENPLSQVSEEQKDKIRVYIQNCRKFNPTIHDTDKEKIQMLMKEQISKKKDAKIDFTNIMLFAKMNARAEGRETITPEDYLLGRQLVMG